ncbi:hypothetical protein HOY80DRAFT_985794 [Tuber brumale]|nr:hypothetical protein HOY80DRAFT_985794 [Tuber brumale]
MEAPMATRVLLRLLITISKRASLFPPSAHLHCTRVLHAKPRFFSFLFFSSYPFLPLDDEWISTKFSPVPDEEN